MAGVEFVPARYLYNILNAEDINGHPALTDHNFLLLVDARPRDRYENGHILFATNGNVENGEFVKPMRQNVECIQNIVIYDDLGSEENNALGLC